MAIFNSYVSLPEGTSGWSTVDIFRYDIHGCLNFCKVWPTKSKLGTWKTPSIPEGVGLAALSLAALAAQLWSYEVMPNWQGWRKLILLNLTCPATHKVAKQKTQLQLIHFLFIKWQGHIERHSIFAPEFHLQRFSVGSGSSFGAGSEPHCLQKRDFTCPDFRDVSEVSTHLDRERNEEAVWSWPEQKRYSPSKCNQCRSQKSHICNSDTCSSCSAFWLVYIINIHNYIYICIYIYYVYSVCMYIYI